MDAPLVVLLDNSRKYHAISVPCRPSLLQFHVLERVVVYDRYIIYDLPKNIRPDLSKKYVTPMR